MSLLGNAWHVGVVAALCQPLLCAQGFVPSRTMQEVMNLLRPGNAPDLAGRLLRPTLEHPQPFAAVISNRDDELELVRKLSHLVSAKGTDVMLTAETEVLPRAHRLPKFANTETVAMENHMWLEVAPDRKSPPRTHQQVRDARNIYKFEVASLPPEGTWPKSFPPG